MKLYCNYLCVYPYSKHSLSCLPRALSEELPYSWLLKHPYLFIPNSVLAPIYIVMWRTLAGICLHHDPDTLSPLTGPLTQGRPVNPLNRNLELREKEWRWKWIRIREEQRFMIVFNSPFQIVEEGCLYPCLQFPGDSPATLYAVPFSAFVISTAFLLWSTIVS